MSFFEVENLRDKAHGQWLQEPRGPSRVDGVGIDTRGALAGKAFVAIAGERHDGHDFLDRAVARGAALLVVDRAPAAGQVPAEIGVLLVDDTRRALGRLASTYRRFLAGTTVIAVTGSVGKTTVKTLIHAVLSAMRRGTAAPRSFNNDIGVPLTILDAAVGDDYLIVEIGSNCPGEIEAMAAIARPDLAVITKVGRAHLEGFGSVEAVAAEKASLLGHLCPGRPAIVNADCRPLRPHLRIPGAVVLCGEAEDADLRLTGRDGAAGWFEVNGRDRFHLGLPGRHNAVNALCAVAVARRLGVPDSMIDAALGACEPVDMRMSRREIGAITVYNDAYNANPDSMIASLEAFGEQTAGVSRRVVVLGDMNELGAAAPELHREVGRSLLEMTRTTPVDHLVLVGELAAFIADPLEASWPPDHLTRLPELTATNAPDIARLLHPGDAVLLKASRTVALERLISAIRDPVAP